MPPIVTHRILPWIWVCALIAACGPGTPATRTFTLDQFQLSIDLPEDFRVDQVGGGDCLICQGGEEERTPRCFSINHLPHPEEIVLEQHMAGRVDWDEGHSLMYSLSHNEGGSAGPEAVMEGVLTMPDSSRFRVICSDQREISDPDPLWCLEYLGTLKRVAVDTAGGH